MATLLASIFTLKWIDHRYLAVSLLVGQVFGKKLLTPKRRGALYNRCIPE